MRYGPIRRNNPGIGETPLLGLFVNPLRRPTAPKKKAKTKAKPKTSARSKNAMAMPKRNAKGRFIKGRKKTTKRRKRNPVSYPRVKNPVSRTTNKRRKPAKRRRRNPVTYPAYPGQYKAFTNPAPRRKRRAMRKYNPNDKAGNMLRKASDLVKPGLAALGGFMAPGLAWEIIGAKGRSSVAGWFKGSDNADAWGRFTVGAITSGALYLISNKIKFLQEVQLPLMLGAIMRNGHDLADAILSTKPGTMGARLRRVLALPTTAQLAAGTGQQQTDQSKQAGWYQDQNTGQWLYTGDQQGQQDQPPGQQDLLAGGEDGQQYGEPMNGQQYDGAPTTGEQGMMGVGASYPLDSGVGEVYVDRELVPVRADGIGEVYVKRELVDPNRGYNGVGQYFVDRNLVYTESGQRFPSRIQSA